MKKAIAVLFIAFLVWSMIQMALSHKKRSQGIPDKALPFLTPTDRKQDSDSAKD